MLDSLKSRIVYTASVDGGTTINGDLSTLETGLKTLTVPANGKVTISWEWPHDRYNNGGYDVQDTAVADLAKSRTDLRLVVRLAYQAVQVD